MKLNHVEETFFYDIMNIELDVPITATLTQGADTFPLVVVPEIAPQGYFRFRYSNAPAFEGQTVVGPDGSSWTELAGDEIFGIHPTLQQLARDRVNVDLQLHTAANPMRANISPKLNARVLVVDPGNRGELVLADSQAAVAVSPLRKAEFSISGFHDFVVPGRSMTSYAALTQQDHETLALIGQKLGGSVRLSISPAQANIDLQTGDGWQVTLTKDELQTRDQVSHTGIVQKDNGDDFSVEELETVLDGFRNFIAFSLGQFCPPSIVVGYDANGKVIWGQTGSFDLKPRRTRNWFNHAGNALYGDILERFFPAFWAKWLLNSDEISKVIDCYVTSNSMRSSGILRDAVAKSFAGLEILTGMDLGKPIKSGAGCAVDGALRRYHIDHRTLSSSDHPVLHRLCTDLNVVGQEGGRLLAEVRNYVTHVLDNKNPVVKPGHLKYADGDLANYLHLHDLSQFYLEYLFLGFCGVQAQRQRDLIA